MRECRRLCLAAATCFSLVATTAHADETPPPGPARLQLSLLGPIQLVPESRDVAGLRLALINGKNADVSGLDIAAFGFTQSKTLTGVQLALFGNAVEGRTTGLQAGLLGNFTGQLYGAQIGGIFANIAREGGEGLQLGVSNFASGKFTGVQIGWIGNAYFFKGTTPLSVTGVEIGLLNIVDGDVTGVQIGAWNAAGLKQGSLTGAQVAAINLGSFAGVQVGVLNVAGDCKGLQLGVFNLCKDMLGVQIGLINFIDKGVVRWLPIVNAKF
jgi:hypothetical protein